MFSELAFSVAFVVTLMYDYTLTLGEEVSLFPA
jgi:hypothetical protein